MERKYSPSEIWRNPELYTRIKPEDMKSNEAVLILCEEILRGLREECGDIVKDLKNTPEDGDLIQRARRMNRYLLSDEISSMSFGGSITFAKEFREKCPEGVFCQ